MYALDIPRDKCLYTMKNEAIGEVIAKKVGLGYIHFDMMYTHNMLPIAG